MYVLINKTFMTIPYKHQDYGVLSGMVIIEFPIDEIRIIPIDNPHCFDEFTNKELTEFCERLGGISTTNRTEIITNLMWLLDQAEVSKLNKFQVMTQANSFDAYKTNRHRYVENSSIADHRVVSVPNLLFVQKSAKSTLKNGDNSKGNAVLAVKSQSIDTAQISSVNVDNKLSEIEQKLDSWYTENCEMFNVLDATTAVNKIKEFLTKQGIAPWSLNKMVDDVKNRLTGVK